ncbi:MAG: hypothetical protein HQ534_09035 [Armatimonadetes bacterium]|nr:hypothetical protein [Armatimonadota bacterium]
MKLNEIKFNDFMNYYSEVDRRFKNADLLKEVTIDARKDVPIIDEVLTKMDLYGTQDKAFEIHEEHLRYLLIFWFIEKESK